MADRAGGPDRIPAPWYRSFLFVPAHKAHWMANAAKAGADAVVFDLEDSVPSDRKPEARAALSVALRAEVPPLPVFVRVNGWGSGHTLDDVIDTVSSGVVRGIVLAKTTTAADVEALERVLRDLEGRYGLDPIEIVPLLETAQSFKAAGEIFTCSGRVLRTGGWMIPRGDLTTSLGAELSADQHEAAYMSGKIVFEARAAGVPFILAGFSMSIDDLDDVRRVAEWCRRYGTNCSMAIHPNQIPVINQVFSPTAEQLQHAAALLDALAAAIARGDSAVAYRGEMIDYAQAKNALQLLRNAQQMGLATPDFPDLGVALG